MKLNKQTQNVLLVIAGIAFLTFLYEYGTRQYYYWTKGCDKKTYDVLNASINIILVILHIVTIGFLILNYWIQRSEIKKRDKDVEDNKRDNEFNRVLDILYRHQEAHRDRYDKDLDFLESLDAETFYFKNYLLTFEYFNSLSISLENELLFFKELTQNTDFSSNQLNILEKIYSSFFPLPVTLFSLRIAMFLENERDVMSNNLMEYFNPRSGDNTDYLEEFRKFTDKRLMVVSRFQEFALFLCR